MVEQGPDPGTEKVPKPERYGAVLTNPDYYTRNVERLPLKKPEKYATTLTDPDCCTRNVERIPPKSKDPEVER